MRRRLILMFMTFCVVFTLIACSKKEDVPNTPTPTEGVSTGTGDLDAAPDDGNDLGLIGGDNGNDDGTPDDNQYNGDGQNETDQNGADGNGSDSMGGSTSINSTDSLEDILAGIYASVTSIEATMGPTTQIDMTNINNVTYYIGLDSADRIKEAVYSEPMIGSIPLSVCLVRAKDITDTEQLKKDMAAGINERKWLCVAAEKVLTADWGDVVLLVMADETVTEDVYKSFAALAGADIGEPIRRNGEE